MSLSKNAASIEQRKINREREKSRVAKHEERIAMLAARILRKHDVDGDTADRAARWLEARRYDADRLPLRPKPEVFKGWRKDFASRVGYLGISASQEGLPLAHEGGWPWRCVDNVTNELAMANYRAWLARQPWAQRACG